MAAFTQRMRAGDWSYAVGSELYGSTVGIVGLGRVGRGVARRLAGFDVTLLATDIAPDAAAYGAAQGITMVTLPALLRRSDYVTLHAPLDAGTAGMMDEAAFAQMKPGAILINTARGGLVREDALLAALRTGHLAGAGLDVFEAEKDPAHSQAAAALCALPNVVATPHTAAATHAGLARTNLIAAQTVVALLDGTKPPPDCIVVDGRRV
jgi:D-3-phosphoglycerate dehydrogenase